MYIRDYAYSEVSQDDVAFQVIRTKVEFLQRRIAVIDPGIIIDFFYRVQLILLSVVL